MSDIVITARDLTKVYRLYRSAGSRFLDIFGMLRTNQGAYTEHAALAGINLEIRRGEKVAFIGRNGAGKSTLLKLLTGVIEPTSGTLKVEGKAHALLQIGSGFHPDFTGRENVYAYLAQLGVTGREADRQYADIVEFAELEEYIGQPVKTYSSGMAVRLMFATSTAITPDLLVLDEVLGVGDAYFARKSYERIRELCDHQGTTLLLVSHDVYSASRICERMIWLDRGRVVADLPPSETLKLYEDSVRLQEEERLRKKSINAIRLALDAVKPTPTADVLTVELSFADAPKAPIYVERIAISDGDRGLAEIRPAEVSDLGHELIDEGSSWGQPELWRGKHCRPLKHYGSVFHRGAAGFHNTTLFAGPRDRLRIDVDLGVESTTRVNIRSFINAIEVQSAEVVAKPGWQRVEMALAGSSVATPAPVGWAIGTGALSIEGARVFDQFEQPTIWLAHGQAATMEFDYEIRDPALRGPLDVAVSVLRGGVETSCRFFTRDLVFSSATASRGTIRMHLPSLILGAGFYSVVLMIARLGYADEEGHVFYSINPDVLTCVRDILSFEVKGGNLFATGTPVLAPALWAQHAAASEESQG